MYPDQELCPQTVKEALGRYVEHRIETGGFLRAVLENNLKESFQRADSWNLENMAHIVCYVYNVVPRAAWGSPEKVSAWLASRKVEE